MKKVFITGASGFVGTHLIEHLLSKKIYKVYGTAFGETNNYIEILLPKSQIVPLNLLDKSETTRVVKNIKPDYVIHLAAISSPALSFKDPLAYINNNIGAQINLFEALISQKNKPITLVIGSAEEYGLVKKGETPVKETNPLRPLNPYAVSKIAQDYLGLQYFHAHKLPVIRLRPFNHTGERRPPTFVLPAFAKQIAEIEVGLKKELVVKGDLSITRDFTDVKDIVIAYELALLKCQPGEVYNLGSGKPTKIKQLIDILVSFTDKNIKVTKDPKYNRPVDVKILVCDSSKFISQTGWKPRIPLEDTVKRVLNYWRQKVRQKK